MRIRALPFMRRMRDYIERYDSVFVVELNRDGQMHMLLSMEYPDLAEKLISISRIDGLPFTAEQILEHVQIDELKL